MSKIVSIRVPMSHSVAIAAKTMEHIIKHTPSKEVEEYVQHELDEFLGSLMDCKPRNCYE